VRGVKEVSNVGKWGQAALQNSSRALMCTSVCLSARPKNHTCVPSAKLIYLINQHQWVAATCGLQTLHHLAWHCTYICAPVVQKEQMNVVLQKGAQGEQRVELPGWKNHPAPRWWRTGTFTDALLAVLRGV
jgi:hypothetical protein